MPRAANGLTSDRLRELARAGAEVILKELRAEIIAIERTFPELALPKRRRALRRSVNKATERARTMSAAASRAVSERMKRYWAERRKAKSKIKYITLDRVARFVFGLFLLRRARRHSAFFHRA